MKKDLKNTYIVELRDPFRPYFMVLLNCDFHHGVFKNSDFIKDIIYIVSERKSEWYSLKEYSENLKHVDSPSLDIMKVYRKPISRNLLNNYYNFTSLREKLELIWEREE